MRYMPLRRVQSGFTILELMVAMSVFSMILLVSTVVIVQIDQLYYKGVNAAKTQDTARNLVNDISETIKFSGAATMWDSPTSPQPFSAGGQTARVAAWCAGNVRYSFLLDHQLEPGGPPTTDQSPHVLWKDIMPAGSSCQPTNLLDTDPPGGSSGQELLQPNMRLTGFLVALNDDGSYEIITEVAFGPTDLLVSGATPFDSHCKDTQGTQFCATSTLDTTVVRRVE